jgi:uncharacterized integral membrane protein
MPGRQEPGRGWSGARLLGARLPFMCCLFGARRSKARSVSDKESAGETPQAAIGTERQLGKPEPTEPVIGSVRHTRISAAWTAVAVAALLGVALIVFIVQNTQKVQVKFFGASGHVPLVVALLAAAIVGALIVLVAGISRITQLRLSARRRSKRTKDAGPSSFFRRSPRSHDEVPGRLH